METPLETKVQHKSPVSAVVTESLTNLVTAFSLVAALAWNEAVKSLINEVLPKGQSVLSHFIYALAVTVLAVILGSRLLRLKNRW